MKKLIQFELRKIFSKRLTQIALLFVLFFSAILGFSSYQNKYAFDGVSKEGTGKTSPAPSAFSYSVVSSVMLAAKANTSISSPHPAAVSCAR